MLNCYGTRLETTSLLPSHVTDQLNHPLLRCSMPGTTLKAKSTHSPGLHPGQHLSPVALSSRGVLGIRTESKRDAPSLLWCWIVPVRRWHGRRFVPVLCVLRRDVPGTSMRRNRGRMALSGADRVHGNA